MVKNYPSSALAVRSGVVSPPGHWILVERYVRISHAGVKGGVRTQDAVWHAWQISRCVDSACPRGIVERENLRTLEANMQEAILAYLKTVEPDEPLPDFVGTWRVEVAA